MFARKIEIAGGRVAPARARSAVTELLAVCDQGRVAIDDGTCVWFERDVSPGDYL